MWAYTPQTASSADRKFDLNGGVPASIFVNSPETFSFGSINPTPPLRQNMSCEVYVLTA